MATYRRAAVISAVALLACASVGQAGNHAGVRTTFTGIGFGLVRVPGPGSFAPHGYGMPMAGYGYGYSTASAGYGYSTPSAGYSYGYSATPSAGYGYGYSAPSGGYSYGYSAPSAGYGYSPAAPQGFLLPGPGMIGAGIGTGEYLQMAENLLSFIKKVREGGVGGVDTKEVEKLRTDLEKRLDKIENRLDTLEKDYKTLSVPQKLDERLNALDKKLTDLGAKLDTVLAKNPDLKR